MIICDTITLLSSEIYIKKKKNYLFDFHSSYQLG